VSGPVDPDELLKNIRVALGCEPQDYKRLREAVETMDGWLRLGGRLPVAWKPNARFRSRLRRPRKLMGAS